MCELQDRGLSASDRKSAERLDRSTGQAENEPDEVGIYKDCDTESPQGERFWVKLDSGSNIYGEFITPAAPAVGTRVACYKSGGGKWLFDCR